jgi:hypothetical protein
MREGISDCLDLPGVRHHLSLQRVYLLRRDTLDRSQDAEVVVQEHRKVTHIEIVEDILMGVSNDASDSGPVSCADNLTPQVEL